MVSVVLVCLYLGGFTAWFLNLILILGFRLHLQLRLHPHNRFAGSSPFVCALVFLVLLLDVLIVSVSHFHLHFILAFILTFVLSLRCCFLFPVLLRFSFSPSLSHSCFRWPSFFICTDVLYPFFLCVDHAFICSAWAACPFVFVFVSCSFFSDTPLF